MDAAPSPFAGRPHVAARRRRARRRSRSRERKPAHLVFLVDVSGSMASPDKLPLAKQSLHDPDATTSTDSDTVSLVTYAGDTRVVLPPTGIEHKDRILAAIDDLESGGSTGDGLGHRPRVRAGDERARSPARSRA